MEQFHALTLEVEKQLETADAVVVTTGTDTQEEFAYWLDLTVQSRKPVITSGSMRPWGAGDTRPTRRSSGPTHRPTSTTPSGSRRASRRTASGPSSCSTTRSRRPARSPRRTPTAPTRSRRASTGSWAGSTAPTSRWAARRSRHEL
ncbi:asparaginase domain-containing protein [Oerskovia sp. M15]